MRSAENRVLDEHTLFDMASVTKIVVTTSLALIAMDEGALSPEDKVSRFFSVPEDKSELTVKHLMTHTMGIGHKSLLGGEPCGIENYILNIPCDIPVGSDARYSCPAFILLGRILEKLYGERLDALFEKRVAKPLGMSESGFLPDRERHIVNSIITEGMCGRVHDYNCRHLGGVCGNAGLFSNLEDMTKYAKMLVARGEPIISRDTLALAAENYTVGMSADRGLGFLYVTERYAQGGGLFPSGSIGHCGHTGQSVFVDMESGLYVIILSDATVSTVRKYGKERYSDVTDMRGAIHAAIKVDLGL
jgi:CubicO group peptidase (beta-lactamase class C family)